MPDLAGLPRVGASSSAARRVTLLATATAAPGRRPSHAGPRVPDPAHRARHRRHARSATTIVDRPRARVAAVAAAMERGIAVSLVTGRMVSSAMRFALELGLTGPIVGYQGGLIRAMPRARLAASRQAPPAHALSAAVAREIVVWTREHGLDPHVNHLERFILRADDPSADDYSAFMGARAELVPDLLELDHATRSRRSWPWASRPLPVEVAPLARAHFARPGRRHHLASAVPGVRRARASRRAGRSAGSPGGCGSRSERRSRSATSGTTSRCSPRSVMARRCRARRPRSARSARYVAPPLEDEGVGADHRAARPRAAARDRAAPRRRRPAAARAASVEGCRHDGAGRAGRRGWPGVGRRDVLRERAACVALPDRHGLRHRGRRCDTRWHRAAVPRETAAAGQGGHAAPRRRGPGGTGGLDARRPRRRLRRRAGPAA